MGDDVGGPADPVGAVEPVDPVVARFLAELERRLGMAIIVHSVEGDGPLRIEATLMRDGSSTDVTVEGEYEAEAWDRLAQASLAWRNSDPQNVRIFGGGGGI